MNKIEKIKNSIAQLEANIKIDLSSIASLEKMLQMEQYKHHWEEWPKTIAIKKLNISKWRSEIQKLQNDLRQAQFADENGRLGISGNAFIDAGLPLLQKRGLPDYEENRGGEDDLDDPPEPKFLDYINPSPQTHIPTIIQKPPKPILPRDEAVAFYITDFDVGEKIYISDGKRLKDSVEAKVDLRQQEKDGLVTPVGKLRSIEAFTPIPGRDMSAPVFAPKPVLPPIPEKAMETQKRSYVSNPIIIVVLLAGAYFLTR